MCLLLIVYVQDKCLTKRWAPSTFLSLVCCALFVPLLALPYPVKILDEFSSESAVNLTS